MAPPMTASEDGEIDDEERERRERIVSMSWLPAFFDVIQALGGNTFTLDEFILPSDAEEVQACVDDHVKAEQDHCLAAHAHRVSCRYRDDIIKRRVTVLVHRIKAPIMMWGPWPLGPTNLMVG